MSSSDEMQFPLTLHDSGEVTEYVNVADLKCTLEDFHFDLEPNCDLRDALGRKVRLKMSLMRIDVFELEEPVDGRADRRVE